MASLPPRKKPKLDNMSNDICIDPHGDLTLVVGPEKVKMRVDANALRRASRVFSAMLFGPFLEAKRTADWSVELPEDDPEALEVIFNAAHARNAKIPQKLELSKRYAVAVMADKYLMVDLLRGPLTTPWTRTGCRNRIWTTHPVRTTYEDLQMLCVMRYFGSPRQLKDTVMHLIFMSKTNPEGKLIFTRTSSGDWGDTEGDDPEGDFEEQTSEWESFWPLSQTIIDLVRINRQRIISRLLRALKDLFKIYQSAACDAADAWTKRKQMPNCRSTAFGVMVDCLSRNGLWPIPSGKDASVCLSIKELDDIAQMLRQDLKDMAVKSCGQGCIQDVNSSHNVDSGRSFDRFFNTCRIELPREFVPGDEWQDVVGWDDLVSQLYTIHPARKVKIERSPSEMIESG